MPPLENISDDELPPILKTFYTEQRTMSGELYAIQSLKCIQAGINRFTKEHRNLDIISDTCYAQCNEMFKGVMKQSKKNGKGTIKLTKAILQEDMIKIGQYFNHDIMNHPDLKKVQKCVLFKNCTFSVDEAERIFM